jgi:hypothetical protein
VVLVYSICTAVVAYHFTTSARRNSGPSSPARDPVAMGDAWDVAAAEAAAEVADSESDWFDAKADEDESDPWAEHDEVVEAESEFAAQPSTAVLAAPPCAAPPVHRRSNLFLEVVREHRADAESGDAAEPAAAPSHADRAAAARLALKRKQMERRSCRSEQVVSCDDSP